MRQFNRWHLPSNIYRTIYANQLSFVSIIIDFLCNGNVRKNPYMHCQSIQSNLNTSTSVAVVVVVVFVVVCIFSHRHKNFHIQFSICDIILFSSLYYKHYMYISMLNWNHTNEENKTYGIITNDVIFDAISIHKNSKAQRVILLFLLFLKEKKERTCCFALCTCVYYTIWIFEIKSFGLKINGVICNFVEYP